MCRWADAMCAACGAGRPSARAHTCDGTVVCASDVACVNTTYIYYVLVSVCLNAEIYEL